MFFRKQNPQTKSKEKHHNKILLRNALFLSLFLFSWLLILHNHFLFSFQPTPTKSTPTIIDDLVRTCNANYSVFIYDLPEEFNSGLTADCHNLNVYTDMCPHVANRGLGRPIAPIGPQTTARPSWFATHQFIAEMIFHARVENHPCRTRDPSRATLFYVPFYGGLHASSKFREGNLTARDELAVGLAGFVQRQPWFRRSRGRDHFVALGRTSWDFMRPDDGSAADFGANRLLRLPPVANMTVLTVERHPWKGRNQKGIPYPSYFHPSTRLEMSTWQARVRLSRRPWLFSFVGGPRGAGLEKAAVRERLFRQCEGSRRCELLRCDGAGRECHNPARVMGVMKRSEFCLQAPGDSFTRRSTFDAVLAGCIPVFFSPHTAYSQYEWFAAAAEKDEWSVFIDEKSADSAAVEAVLAAIPRERVKRMRERVVEMIPRMTYAHPDSGVDKGFDDAVDLALASLANHLRVS